MRISDGYSLPHPSWLLCHLSAVFLRSPMSYLPIQNDKQERRIYIAWAHLVMMKRHFVSGVLFLGRISFHDASLGLLMLCHIIPRSRTSVLLKTYNGVQRHLERGPESSEGSSRSLWNSFFLGQLRDPAGHGKIPRSRRHRRIFLR